MHSAYATDPGLVRKNNEDCILTDDQRGIYLLADGIGGHNAGEVASALAVENVHAVLRANIAHTIEADYFELMTHALHTAHWEIFTRAQADPALSRMGTTLVVVVVRNGKAYVANAGDSRCYLFQREYYDAPDPLIDQGRHKFCQLTNDHTVGDQLLAQGVAAADIPKKQFHALTRSLGCGNPPEPDLQVVDFQPGDLLLICSDGLTDMLTDAELEELLDAAPEDQQLLAMRLVDAANAKGGRDNISVILVSSATDAG